MKSILKYFGLVALLALGANAWADSVCKIGTTEYATLEEAFSAVKVTETVELLCDLDFAGRTWTPVDLCGSFDGQGHKISNLTISLPEQGNVGFFSKFRDQEGVGKKICNITFENADIKGAYAVAVVVGGNSEGTISNVTVRGSIKVEGVSGYGSSGYGGVGTIVGYWGYMKLIDVTVDGLDKTASYVKSGGTDGRYVGGLVGHADDVTLYENCTVRNLRVIGGWLCGGMSGPGPADGVCRNCTVESVDIACDYSGGLFGWFFDNSGARDDKGVLDGITVRDVTFKTSYKCGTVGGYSMDDNVVVKNLTVENVNEQGLCHYVSFVTVDEDDYFYSTIQLAIDNAATLEAITVRDASAVVPDGYELYEKGALWGVREKAAKVAKIGDVFYPTLAAAIEAAGGDLSKIVIVDANPTALEVPAGYKLVDLSNGQYGVAAVVYVAQIGDDKYETLQAAVAAVPANNGENVTIELLADIEIQSYINIGKKYVTIEGNGFSVRPTVGNTLGVWETLVRLDGSDRLVFRNVVFDGRGKYIGLVGNGKNETYENCRFVNAQNAHYYGASQGTVTFDGCLIDTDVYGINQGEGNATLIVTNCTISGWNSFGETEVVRIYDSHFSKGDSDYGVLRFYGDTVVLNSTFADDMDCMDGGDTDDAHAVYFVGCDWEEVYAVTDMADSPKVIFAFDSTGDDKDGFTSGTFITTGSVPVADGYEAVSVEGKDNVYRVVSNHATEVKVVVPEEVPVTTEGGEEVPEAVKEAAATVVTATKEAIAGNTAAVEVADTGLGKAIFAPGAGGEEAKVAKTDIMDGLKAAVEADTTLTPAEKDKALEQIENSEIDGYVDVRLDGTAVSVVLPTQGVAAKVTLTTITYEVQPISAVTVVTKDGEGKVIGSNTVEKVITNEQLAEANVTVTFRLPLTDDFTKNALVQHKGDPDRIVKVLGELGGRYVELEATHFSPFKVSKTDEEVPVELVNEDILGIVRYTGGVKRRDSAEAKEYAVGVPWLGREADGSLRAGVTVDSLITKNGLKAGDELSVWMPDQATTLNSINLGTKNCANQTGSYAVYRWSGTAWEGFLDADTGKAAPAATTTVVDRGAAVWYKRAPGEDNDFTLIGIVSNFCVSAVAPGTTATPTMSLMTNPFPDDAVDATRFTGCQDGDQLVLLNEEGDNAVYNAVYNYKGGWGNYITTTVRGHKSTAWQAATTLVIPAGKSFWYVSRSANVPQIDWKAAKVVPSAE